MHSDVTLCFYEVSWQRAGVVIRAATLTAAERSLIVLEIMDRLSLDQYVALRAYGSRTLRTHQAP